MRKKVLLIATGGTFAATESKNGLRPTFDIKKIADLFPEVKKIADIEALQIFSLDSTNIHPQHWTEMAKVVAENHDKYDGFVISHGTDTMYYSSAALSFALGGIRKPVVFTGSAISIDKDNSDAKVNFLDSVRAASSDSIKEVCVCFHGDIIRGTRARKVANEASKIINEKIGIYASINSYPIGKIDDGKVIKNPKTEGCPENTLLEVLPNFDLKVGHIKLYPGIESEILDYYKDKKAVLIEAFAPGNVPFAYSHWIEGIKKATKNKTSIFVTTQNPFGAVDMEMYEVGQRAMKAGAIPCHDMLPEAALVKLMWILGNFPGLSNKELEKMFLRNFCGEIRKY